MWYFSFGKSFVISDQDLANIGSTLSTSIGVLTAIIVSFSLLVWQTSRRDRSESFLRWRSVLNQLFEFYDAHMEEIFEIKDDIKNLTWEGAAVSAISPMSRERCKTLVSITFDKITRQSEQDMNIKNLTKEQLFRAKAGTYITNYLVLLVHANLDHNIAHNLYKGLLRLRGLLYRLLFILIISITVTFIANVRTSFQISDTLNIPIALVLIIWVVYVFIQLGFEVKKFTRFEDELRRQETVIFPNAI